MKSPLTPRSIVGLLDKSINIVDLFGIFIFAHMLPGAEWKFTGVLWEYIKNRFHYFVGIILKYGIFKNISYINESNLTDVYNSVVFLRTV